MKRILLTLTLVLFIAPIAKAQDLPTYVPTEGLVAYYPFNGNANDESGNGNQGTVNGATLTSDRDGNEESAFYFSGSNCSTRIDANVDMSTVLNSMTVSMWINKTGDGCIFPRVFDFYDGGDSSNDWGEAWGNNTNFNNVSSIVNSNVWYQLVITTNTSNNEKKYYVNGILEKTTPFGKTLPLSGDLSIGRMNHPAYDAFNGVIDDFGIWNRALTEQEIQNLYTSSTGDILLNGTVSVENNQIKNVAEPTHTQDAVTLGLLLEKISNLQDQIDALQSTSGSGTVTDQDGNSYPYLTYGDQVWTVKNAEMVTYRDGTEIPQVTDATEWQNLTTGAWCYYNNDPTKGKLYNWYAVAGIHDTDPNTPNKAFAPEGWHVPTDAEWTTLENYLIANGYNSDGTTTGNKIAKAMASTTGWDSRGEIGAPGNDQSLNNSSGFNAFPEGYRYNSGSFNYEGSNALFWSSTENNSDSAWDRNLFFNYSFLDRYDNDKRNGFSVRFVRD